jgi:hypothetical protein
MKFSTMAERAGFHDFQVSDGERRQYPRLSLTSATSPMWWFSGEIGGVKGIATEISAGGIQFLLKRRLPKRECSIAFQVNDRKMWAKVSIVRTTQAMHEDQCWNCYGANFEGLLESDFDFIVALSDTGVEPHSEAGWAGSPAQPFGQASPTASAVSISSLQSNEGLLPAVAREQIVQMLVAMDRLQAVENMYFALVAIHYVGIHPSAEADVLYHRFAVRTRKNTDDGRVVYNTHFLVSDDGLKILLHE